MPAVVSIVGKQNSGKTTLLEKLIPALTKQGYRIGTIKHHVHEFDMDKPGKDTWRHKRAGAAIVALSSPTGLGVIRETDREFSIEEINTRYFNDVDLVLTEGYKKAAMPKIEIFRSSVHAKPLAAPDDTWAAIVSDIPIATELPRFHLEDIRGLASFLIEKFIKPADEPRTELIVNGRSISLSQSLEKAVRQSIAGLTELLPASRSPIKELTITIPASKAASLAQDR